MEYYLQLFSKSEDNVNISSLVDQELLWRLPVDISEIVRKNVRSNPPVVEVRRYDNYPVSDGTKKNIPPGTVDETIHDRSFFSMELDQRLKSYLELIDSKNEIINDGLIHEKAKKFAEELNIKDFKNSKDDLAWSNIKETTIYCFKHLIKDEVEVEKSDTECLKLIKFVKEAAIPDPISIEDFLKIDYDENEAILSEIVESPKDTVDQLKTIKEESIPEKVSEEFLMAI
ncbi:hypothetical protein A3Q56_02315 [Intoshia linei]|uniref:Uncharacterized protein n=1 Tax=Intoshia linei TaxID=1819745 RepID=A0A177B8H2_9BILA|nr:hypothetical protein A3Q56_02315 [Intoshia linei]